MSSSTAQWYASTDWTWRPQRRRHDMLATLAGVVAELSALADLGYSPGKVQ
ncbi:hypothetical protein ACVCAH_17305 [Micromonospora sp. LZ34]